MPGCRRRYAAILADSDRGIARGELLVTSGDLSRLIGRPTTSMREAVRAATAQRRLPGNMPGRGGPEPSGSGRPCPFSEGKGPTTAGGENPGLRGLSSVAGPVSHRTPRSGKQT